MTMLKVGMGRLSYVRISQIGKALAPGKNVPREDRLGFRRKPLPTLPRDTGGGKPVGASPSCGEGI